MSPGRPAHPPYTSGDPTGFQIPCLVDQTRPTLPPLHERPDGPIHERGGRVDAADDGRQPREERAPALAPLNELRDEGRHLVEEEDPRQAAAAARRDVPDVLGDRVLPELALRPV